MTAEIKTEKIERSDELMARHEADIQRLYSMSVPTWIRALLISVLGFLFYEFYTLHSTLATSYVTVDEFKDTRNELKEEQLRTQVKLDKINEKLDAVLIRMK
jgi:hypothetical protein